MLAQWPECQLAFAVPHIMFRTPLRLVLHHMQPRKVLRPGEVFSRLDAHLKASQTRLSDLFSRYARQDTQRGELTMPELATLLRDLRLDAVTNADIAYFQVSVYLHYCAAWLVALSACLPAASRC